MALVTAKPMANPWRLGSSPTLKPAGSSHKV